MHPSTEPSPEQPATEADSKLLHRIEVENANAAAYPRPGRCTFLVSHAWTEGAVMHLVYEAPPSNRTWGLVRDTRELLINPSPWNEADDTASYYYLLDLEENWPGASSRAQGESDEVISGGAVTHVPNSRPTSPSFLSSIATHRRRLTRPGSIALPRPSWSPAAMRTRTDRYRKRRAARPSETRNTVSKDVRAL